VPQGLTAATVKHGLGRNKRLRQRLDAACRKTRKTGGIPFAEILARLATYLENTARLRKKVKSAMMYPTVVTVVAIAITIFLLVKVVPVFGEIFNSFGAELPKPTQFLVTLSNIVKRFVIPIILGGIGSVYAWLYFIKTPSGRQFWDARRIRLPVFGSIAHKICLARFTRTLASLIRSGVPILEVLDIVGGAAGNQVVETSIKGVSEDVEKGDNLSVALSKKPIFPPMMLRMVAAGEATGKIDTMLEKMADFWDEEIEAMLDALTSLIEPLLIVFLGVIVGGIVIAMFLPIFKLNEIVSTSKS
jgi:type IV pilus assembly protein PilC